jgi:hypothetical protein
MITPQGRFKTDQKLCLSMSDFHPETWNPLWSVSAVLTGLLTFMLLDEDTVGSITTTASEKRALSRASHTFNRKNKVFQEVFSEFIRDPPTAAAASNTSPAGPSNALGISTDAAGAARSQCARLKKVSVQKLPATANLTTGEATGNAMPRDEVNANVNRDANPRDRHIRRVNNNQDKESLPSLLAWLVVFCGVIFAIVRLISSP